MGFLKKFTSFQRVCIQCHDVPDSDAVGSAFGVYRYLCAAGVDAKIIYGGSQIIQKRSMELLISHCGIPIQHVDELPETDALLVVDGQQVNANVTAFDAPLVASIDHHIAKVEPGEWHVIHEDYQSCSTIVWEMLLEEGYPVKEDKALCMALLYGLYIDSSSFIGLCAESDMNMRRALFEDRDPFFDMLIKCNMSVADLMIAADAMQNHLLDFDTHIAIIEALRCDQQLLGIIGDFMVQIDVVYVTVTYTTHNQQYWFSIRSCHSKIPANQLAVKMSDKIGSGGGRWDKAAGTVTIEKFRARRGNLNFTDYIEEVCRSFFYGLSL